MKAAFTPCSALATLVALLAATGPMAADPLPYWQNTASKAAITAFVGKVAKEGSTDFVPPAGRIAVIDNDGTLWSEQPMYFQAYYIFDRIKTLAPQHPEWKDKAPFASVLKGDLKSALAAGNSDGDFQMLEWTTSGDRPGFAMVVHHDETEREWACDRDSHIGRLNEAKARGWSIASMKNDWKTVHPGQSDR